MYEADYQLEAYVSGCTEKPLREKTISAYIATIRLFSDWSNEKYNATDFKEVKKKPIIA